MGAPVASGTLAESTSGSWPSIHKIPSTASFDRTTLLTLAESDVAVGHDFRSREKQQIKVGVTGGARFVRQGGATPRAGGRLAAAIGCTQPTIRAIAGGHGHVVEAAIGTANRSSASTTARSGRG